MLRVICFNVGNYCGRGVEYCNILHDSVCRNLPAGLLGTFTVFTDDVNEKGYHHGIEIRQAHPDLRGWWSKLYAFKEGLFPRGDRILLFDLDTLICGPLDQIAAYAGPFAILRDFYRPNGLQSSVMAWEADGCANIWDWWVGAGRPELPGGDQEWIERMVLAPDRWQNLYPGQFVSYKVHAKDGLPKGANICVFHGRPRPHEVFGGWVPLVWKIGGGTAASLELICNTQRETIAANIRHAMTLKAGWLKMQPPNDRQALIVAGGPSLNDEISSLRAHARDGDVFAVNNTLPWLAKHGIGAHGHILADAREENSSFVPSSFDDHIQRIYCSQCHPLTLYRAGKNLTLWHPMFEGVEGIVGSHPGAAFIGGGTTTGLKAIIVAYALGYRKIHLYGFDSSYRGTENHAYPQALNDGECTLDAIIDGQTFKCAPWMVTQIEDFQILMPELMTLGCEIHVHGSGALPQAAEAMARRPTLMPPDIRAQEILKRINGAKRGAEIGVFAGDLSKRLLAQKPDLILLMVDSWGENQTEAFKASEDFHSKLEPFQQDYYADLAEMTVSFAEDRAIIIRKPSLDAAREVEDASLDFVFIDADHSYEGCSSDIAAWFPKVKPGGIISGHDYANDEFKFGPMVKRAVDEFISAKNLTLDLGENFTWFAVKPAEGNNHV